MQVKLIVMRPTENGFYLMKIADGGLHLVQLQKQMDGAFIVFFDCPKRSKDKDWMLSNSLFDAASFSERISVS